MSANIIKVNLLPVPKREEVRYLTDKVLDELGKTVDILDKYGAAYDHDTPWKQSYVSDAKFYLYRVRIGAIGRINTCKDAVILAVCSQTRALSHHFTSMGLYYIFRYARQEKRKYFYLKKYNSWINSYLNDVRGSNLNSRFVVYNNGGNNHS